MNEIKRRTAAERLHTWSVVLSAAAFLACIGTIGVLTVTKHHDTLFSPEGETLSEKEASFCSRVTDAFDKNIAGFDRFLEIYGMTQRLLGTTVYEDAGYTFLIRDTKDYLHYYTQPQNPAPYADAVAALSAALEKENIPFLYLQAPTKETEGFTVFPPGIDYANDENSDAMLEALRSRNVDVLSFRECFLNGDYDPDPMFYRTDHHWTTQAAFEAFAITVPYLNETRGWQLNETLCDRENWKSEFFPSSFLGSIGRRLGQELSGLDDYMYLEPAFDTSYQVYYPPESTETPYWTGSFRDTLVRESLLYAEDVSANRYASYFQYDYGQLLIDNLLADNDLHIAVIKDSFALPFTAFLSTVTAHIDMIDLREFEGSVTAHLLQTKPDLVLMLYGNGSFSDIMYAFDD